MGPHTASVYMKPTESKKLARIIKILFVLGILAGITMIVFALRLFCAGNAPPLHFFLLLLPGVIILAVSLVLGFFYALNN